MSSSGPGRAVTGPPTRFHRAREVAAPCFEVQVQAESRAGRREQNNAAFGRGLRPLRNRVVHVDGPQGRDGALEGLLDAWGVFTQCD